jgi:hypothetical protein
MCLGVLLGGALFGGAVVVRVILLRPGGRRCGQSQCGEDKQGIRGKTLRSMTPYSIRFWPNAEEGQGFNGSNDRRVIRIGDTSMTCGTT